MIQIPDAMFSVYEYLKRRLCNEWREFHITMASNRVNNNPSILGGLEIETECQTGGTDREKTDQKKDEKDEIVITELDDENACKMRDVKAAIYEMENRINAKFDKKYNQLEKLVFSK